MQPAAPGFTLAPDQRVTRAASQDQRRGCGLLWIAHARPIIAWFGQRNELRGMSVIELRNNQVRRYFDWPWLSP